MKNDTPETNKIVKTTLRVEVTERLRKMILSNQLKPGERIVETRLAKEFGVSQSPVRESVRDLEMMGLLENTPFKGCIVKEIKARDIEDCYEVRAALEMMSVQKAMAQVDEAGIDQLKWYVDEMYSAAKQEDEKHFIESDIGFHRQIIRMADNQMIEKMWEIVHMGHWTHVTLRMLPMNLQTLAGRHVEVVKAIQEKDTVRAAEVMRHHIIELKDQILIRMDVENG